MNPSLVAAIGGPLVGIGCFLLAARMSRPRPARPEPTPEPVREPLPVKILVREASGDPTGTLVLCDSLPAARRVAEIVARTSGSGVSATGSLAAALAALRAGADVAVCADRHGEQKLSSAGRWPPTIVLGSEFAASREAGPELEHAMRYLEELAAAHTAPPI